MPYVALLIVVLIAGAALLLYRRRAAITEALAKPLVVPALIMGLGLLLRLSQIAATRLHGDEALYCSWGLLIATGKDLLLRTVNIDKPPLLPYTLALSFAVFGPNEVAARLPNLLASVAAIGSLYGLAARLYDRRVAALSALALALSPFDIQFGPTAFTDPLMVSLGLAACLFALSGRWLGAGLALALSVAAKPTGAVFLPPMLFLATVHLRRQGEERPALWRAGLPLLAGPAAVFAALVYWDVIIRVDQPGFLVTQAAHYSGGLRLVGLPEVLPRLQTWLGLLQYTTASAVLNLLIAAGAILLLVRAVWHWRHEESALLDGALLIYATGYLLLHTIVGFGLWDRYLLPLVPVVALLLARVLLLPLAVPFFARGQGAYGLLAALFLTSALLRPAGAALRHTYPLGSDDGRSQGIEDVAAYFRSHVPDGAIVFHQTLGWHLAFYMFGYPYQFPYYPDAAYLGDYVARVPDTPMYIILPAWLPSAEEQAALAQRGWRLAELYRTYRPDGSVSFIICRIERGA